MDIAGIRKLAYFVEIAHCGSISGAARQLSLSPPVVSKALADLETDLGITLFHRTTRKLNITDEGRAVLDQAQAMLASADAALSVGEQRRARPSGPLGLTISTELATTWLPPLVQKFAQHCPDVTITINASDRVIDLGGTSFDVGIVARYRIGSAGRPRETVTSLPLAPVCTPGLADRFLKTGGICVGEPRRLLSWRHADADGRLTGQLDLPVSITVNNHIVARQLALAGFGAALAVHAQVAEDLAEGRLIRIMPERDFGQIDLGIRMRDRLPSPAALAFRDLLLSGD